MVTGRYPHGSHTHKNKKVSLLKASSMPQFGGAQYLEEAKQAQEDLWEVASEGGVSKSIKVNTESDTCDMEDKDSGCCSQQKNSVQEPYTVDWGREAHLSQGCPGPSGLGLEDHPECSVVMATRGCHGATLAKIASEGSF